ncbi:BT_3928 family protein [Aurantibacter sp.]|uniref:BT_3928 family protein n=1 Tax=Aurantibacter sp. TaxID=2807103 RepID=UPI0035C7B152
MNILVQICRILVGGLFIFSGMIKLNDPLGFSYKLQEYFSLEVLDLPVFLPYALGISVVVVVLEVVLGIFLLIGYKSKFTVYTILAMIVFFTFLTFYAAYFEVVKDCGCFGDFLPMKPWESFAKDVVLLVLILILVAGLKHIKPFLKTLPTTIIALLGFVFSLWFGYHVLTHLPVWDFRAYKVGDNIAANMTLPENAQKEVSEYVWTFKVNGDDKEFKTSGNYPTVDGEYVGYEKTVLVEADEPKIFDFSIESQDEDLTQHFLQVDNLVVVVAYNLNYTNVQGMKNIKIATDKAIANGYQVIGLTASGEDLKAKTIKDYGLNFEFYLCDEKVGKTIVRSNPGILTLAKGTVLDKEHYNDVDDLNLHKVGEPYVEPVVKIEKETLYFINDSIATKLDIDALSPDNIERMDVLKDSLLLGNEAYKNAESVIKITLKK